MNNQKLPPILILIFLTSWLNTIIFAQTKENVIDSLMKSLSQRGQFNGSILVVEHGNLLYKNGFGKANMKNKIDFTPSTSCYIASLTKQFTAMGIMILAEQHKLDYNDPLSKYFPQFPPYADKVTLKHLLNHISGIPDYALELGLEHSGLTNTEVLKALLMQDSLNFTPGERFEYSNSGYVLLAMIIEKVSVQPYHVFLKENIFEPLNMKNTFVEDSSHPYLQERAHAYNRFGDETDYDLLTYGEGGIYSSVEDLFKWDQALYTEKLVKASTLEEAFSKVNLNDGSISNYGFGWGLGEYDGQKTTSHAGRYGGFNTYIKRFLNDRNTIIFLTNNDFKNMRAIGDAIINILYNKNYSLPKLSIADAMNLTFKVSGITSAIGQYHSLKDNKDTTYDFDESELNELGYQLLKLNKTAEAIEIFKLNVTSFPSSSNAFDSLGEAYMKHGDKELAIKNYKQSLELDPANSNALNMLEKLNKQ